MSNIIPRHRDAIETTTLYPVPIQQGRRFRQSHALPVPPVTIPEPIAKPEDYNAAGWRIVAIGVATLLSLGGIAMVIQVSRPTPPIFVFEQDGGVIPIKY